MCYRHKRLVWFVSYNIGHDLCYNTHSCKGNVCGATLVMTCVTTQTVADQMFVLEHWSWQCCYNTIQLFWTVSVVTLVMAMLLQHNSAGLNCLSCNTRYDLCYNTNSWSELFLATLIWLVLQHKSVGLNCFLQQLVKHCLCYNTSQLVWIIACNSSIWLFVLQHKSVGLNYFLQQFKATDLCYNTNSCIWTVSCNNSDQLTCVTTQVSWSELFLINNSDQLTCVTTQVSTNGARIVSYQHWYDLCYKSHTMLLWNNSDQHWYALLLQQAITMLLWNISKQHWYGLCCNTSQYQCCNETVQHCNWFVL